MLIQNGTVFFPDHKFAKGDLRVRDGRISLIGPALSPEDGEQVLDASGCYLAPGFVDIHTHGAAGADFCDEDPGAMKIQAGYLGAQGVTSYCAATMALPLSQLEPVLERAGKRIGLEGEGAVLRGINFEGPFSSKEKKGAQCADYMLTPDAELFRRLNALTGGQIRLVDLAPERENALDFIRAVREEVTVSLAHTAADYDCAKAAFEAGATHITHLFNAMPPLHHRKPGVIAAAADYARHVEVISDGVHLHPSIVRLAFHLFGDDRVCLISDAMRACGMPDGDYSLGGQPVTVKDGMAVLKDGSSIAGSVTSLPEIFRRAVSFGIPLESALRAATENPARAVGLIGEIGTIEVGKRADIVLLSQTDLTARQVIIGGKIIR